MYIAMHKGLPASRLSSAYSSANSRCKLQFGESIIRLSLGCTRAPALVVVLLALLLCANACAQATAAPAKGRAEKREIAAPPEWLAKLFPHTSKPGRLARRLRRLDAKEFDANGRRAGWVTVELKYPGLDGGDKTGQARIFLPPVLRENPSRRVPLIFHAGYEVGEGGAARYLAKGCAVCTPHAHPLNPLGRGTNLDRAILHAVRRLPFIDPSRVSIRGGSAGGWMTLMLAAESFPLVWARPDAPPIHWGYNAAYIAGHAKMAAPPAGSKTPRLPVLLAVAGIAEQSRRLYGAPFDSEALLAVSPLAHLDTITVPTLVTFSTADMLVPIDQVGGELAQPFDRKNFPDGFSTAMAERFPAVSGKRTLLEALPRDRYNLFRIPLIENSVPFKLKKAVQGKAKPLMLPFSKDKTWSIAIIEEGGVKPDIGHFKYVWNFDDGPFLKWAEEQGVRPKQLTIPKLKRLIKRFLGEPWRPLRIPVEADGKTIAGNQLDYPEAERADVLLGLFAFSADDACAKHLAKLYAELPADLRALGPRLGDGSPAGVRAAIQALISNKD